MIQLTKELWLKADDSCYIVGKLNTQCRKETQGGRKARGLNNPTYYTTMAQAVSGACARTLRQGVADGTITTLREFIREREKLWTELKTLIVPLDSGEARQNAVGAIPTTPTGNYISQLQNSEREA